MRENHEHRIKVGMSTMDAIMVISDGNPGAVSVIMELTKRAKEIDPDNFMGFVGVLLSLDVEAVYGPRVWMLYKDVCGQDLPKMCAMLRACQTGIINNTTLAHAIDNYGDGLDVEAVCAKVQEKLPKFNFNA